MVIFPIVVTKYLAKTLKRESILCHSLRVQSVIEGKLGQQDINAADRICIWSHKVESREYWCFVLVPFFI